MAPANEHKNIVILGGGIIGCTSAYYLTRHPSYDPSKHKITLLEASKIAGGASGKAGGLLALWAYPSSIVPLSYKLHKELAEEHGGAKRWGYRAVHCGQVDCVGRQLPEQRGNDESNANGTNSNGQPGAGGKADNVSLQKNPPKKDSAKRGAMGIPEDLEWVAQDALRAYDEMGDPSTTAQVHPRRFTESMIELAKEKGVEVKTQSPVKSINYKDNEDQVESVTYTNKSTGQEETIPATDIVLAAGPWTRSVYPSAPIGALRAHSVTIKADVSPYALFTQIRLPSKFPSTKSKGPHSGTIVSPEIYARPNNEVYACGEGDHEVPLPSSSDDVEVDQSRCQDIVDFVSSISDELRNGEVTARQACYLPSVNGSNSPLVGPTGVKGLWMAAGHTCWGIQNGPGTGKLVSEFVFDGKAQSAKVQGLDPRNYL
ncbi:putative FAD dependent oxidoreductase, FAD/NAD(P)-binding domain superfamily [Septoria linicola]|nr:putative FAD dependent oxidoreductase, FAD/NAD(P)-binding domain superfamily [Septoria linicola]